MTSKGLELASNFRVLLGMH